jgi:homocysteine S-methyltransferase
VNVFERLLSSNDPILAEGSVYELLRRDSRIVFDPEIAHAGLIYDESFRDRLAAIHLGYVRIARERGLPLVMLTDTWRASAERVARSRFAGRAVNEDNVRFMRELRDSAGPDAPPVAIAGLTGPRGDAYQPSEAPGRDEARDVHRAQVEALARAGVDVLFAATLPSVDEALGIADAMAGTGSPYVLSFVVRPDGTVLFGTRLAVAIARLDGEVERAPTGFSVNCVHPSVFSSAMNELAAVQPELVDRVLWFQANTSEKSPEEIDGSDVLEEGEPVAYAELLAACGVTFRTRVLGGCCGSGVRHIEELARLVQARRG